MFTSPTNWHFILLSDANTDSLRFVLRQIYSGPFVEWVIRNPLVDPQSTTHGIDCQGFRHAVDQHISALSMFR